jgi:hypothetical protein
MPPWVSRVELKTHDDIHVIQANYHQHIREKCSQLGEKLKSTISCPFYESYRYHLQSLYFDADYVIDLHSSSNISRQLWIETRIKLATLNALLNDGFSRNTAGIDKAIAVTR